MLPLILFAVLFGLAVGRLSDAKRGAVLRVAEGIAEAMQRIVVWILGLAPIGVFALAVPLAARLGLSAAGARGLTLKLSMNIPALPGLRLVSCNFVTGLEAVKTMEVWDQFKALVEFVRP